MAGCLHPSAVRLIKKRVPLRLASTDQRNIGLPADRDNIIAVGLRLPEKLDQRLPTSRRREGRKIDTVRLQRLGIIISSFLVLLVGCADSPGTEDNIRPQSAVEFGLFPDGSRPLQYAIRRGEVPIIELSPLGLIIEGEEPAVDEIHRIHSREFEELFPARGSRSRASARGREEVFRIGSGVGSWRVQVRTFPDGVAWRYHYLGPGPYRILGEETAFSFPIGTVIWATGQTRNYEGEIHRWVMGEGGLLPLPEEEPNTLGLPLTFRLPDGSYGAILENSAPGYSGMTLAPQSGRPVLAAVFAGDPGGWMTDGEISSSWRVVLTGPTLDDLVRSDILLSLSPPPDPKIFPDGLQTDWCRPGLCGWSWWAEGTDGMAWERQTGLVDRCAELGFPYYLVDVGWEDPGLGWIPDEASGPWDRLEELCRYAGGKGVGIWVWRSRQRDPDQHWPGLEDLEKRVDFFRRVRRAGVVGVKVDYIDSESSAALAWMREILEEAARHCLMVNFHGSPKPAGESRTWPNEMTREGIRGLEYNKWNQPLSPAHYSRVLFNRCLAGHADFTPVALLPSGRKATGPVFQLATGVLMTSPLMVLAELPETYCVSPFRQFLEDLPSVWDDTRVVEGSKIGGAAGLIRRAGAEWWIAVINPGPETTITVSLGFLSPGEYQASIWRDGKGEDPVAEARRVDRSDSLGFLLPTGGGGVATLRPCQR